MVTWLFLTCGIFLGAHWAYSVLGWGGYWGWDPVENASLMPWLTGTAFLHSVMMQEKRGMMKNWNVWLIFSTFLLTILGTLLTRSGIISSVHAFAESSIGAWFYTFIVIAFLVCLLTFILRRDHLKSENKLESLVSRESSFLFNNMILLAACLTVLFGTLFPLLSEAVTGSKVTTGAAYYNRVKIPIGLFLLFLTGIGPLLAWRSTTLRSIRRNFVLPSVAMAATAVGLMIAGLRPWNDGDDMESTFFSLIAFTLAAGVITAIVEEFTRGARVVRTQTGKNLLASAVLLTRRNTRRYGGYIIHFGIVVMFIGIAGGAFNQAREMEMSYGDTLSIGPYRLINAGNTQDSKPEYDTDYARLDVYKNGKYITQLAPEKRTYFAGTDHEQASTIVALHSTAQADLYTVFEGRNPDSGRPIIKVFLNPLIAWIWIGVVIVVLGTFIALVPNLVRSPARVRQEDSVAAAGRGERCGEGAPCVSPHDPDANNFEARGSRVVRCSGRGRCSSLCSASSPFVDAGRGAVALRPPGPRADVQLRVRADPAGVQPRGLPGFGAHDRRAEGADGRRRATTPRCSTGLWRSTGRRSLPRPSAAASTTWRGSCRWRSFCWPRWAPSGLCGVEAAGAADGRRGRQKARRQPFRDRRIQSTGRGTG